MTKDQQRKIAKLVEPHVRVGLAHVGPHTACCLLGLWSEGKTDLTLREFRVLVKAVSMFLEELEEIRGEVFMDR